MKFFALILAIVSTFMLTGMSECGPCPKAYTFFMESGSYSYANIFELKQPPPDGPPFPHFHATDMHLNVDVDSRTAVLEYQKEGKTIVETWVW
jgi:hypothetical protein